MATTLRVPTASSLQAELVSMRVSRAMIWDSIQPDLTCLSNCAREVDVKVIFIEPHCTFCVIAMQISVYGIVIVDPDIAFID